MLSKPLCLCTVVARCSASSWGDASRGKVAICAASGLRNPPASREDEAPGAAFDAFEQALGLGEPVDEQDDPETVRLIVEGERLR
jgi:hypothetical protein